MARGCSALPSFQSSELVIGVDSMALSFSEMTTCNGAGPRTVWPIGVGETTVGNGMSALAAPVQAATAVSIRPNEATLPNARTNTASPTARREARTGGRSNRSRSMQCRKVSLPIGNSNTRRKEEPRLGPRRAGSSGRDRASREPYLTAQIHSLPSGSPASRGSPVAASSSSSTGRMRF